MNKKICFNVFSSKKYTHISTLKKYYNEKKAKFKEINCFKNNQVIFKN